MTRRYPPTGNPGGRGTRKDAATVAARTENVAELLAQRERIERIAARLGVHCRTVYRHMARIRTAEGSAA
jgi:DNA invertase Pin-like site-specific DNA recombinase